MEPGALAPLNCVYRDDPHGIFLYQGDCLEVLDAIAAKHPDGCFDMMLPLDDKRRLVKLGSPTRPTSSPTAATSL